MSETVSDPTAQMAAVADARRAVAAAQAHLAVVARAYADARIAADREAQRASQAPGRARPGEFVADELSLTLREQPYHVSRLLARTRRLAGGLPTVWAAYAAGELDPEQVRVVDGVARRVTEASTLDALDRQVVDAAQSRCPKQLGLWALKLVVALEPDAFATRHRRALAERRVTVVQGVDGIGYVTGEMSAHDAAAIDGMLTSAARSLGKDDPRTHQQRRSDLFADLLLGRLGWDDQAEDEADPGDEQPSPEEWLETEEIDPDTGELLGTTWRRLDAGGAPVGPAQPAVPAGPFVRPRLVRRPRRLRIGVVVPLSSLLGLTDAPAELVDRTGLVPGEELRQMITDLLHPDGSSDSRDEVMFTRLLTDDGGRLLDVTELGRYPSRRLAEAVMLRAGTCRFPTCSVPADRCDIDHHEPVPRGPTAARNLDPPCRRHHRGKTQAWHATTRDHDGVDWTMPDGHRYRCLDEPLPTGTAIRFHQTPRATERPSACQDLPRRD